MKLNKRWKNSNFEEKKTKMTFQENDCNKFQDFCMDEHNAVDCGIPLLNISVHCQLDNRTMVSYETVYFLFDVFYTIS